MRRGDLVSVALQGDMGKPRPAQVMVDKPQSVARDQIGSVLGDLDAAAMRAVNRALAVFLGLG